MKKKSDKIKVLIGCSKGLNRSKYLAGYLRRKGYSTKYGGVEGWEGNTEKYWNPITQEIVDWADIIILVRPRLEKILKEKFKTKKQKFISFNVSDSKRLLPKEFKELAKLDYKNFQTRWTRPQLRKAIKPYLPLKK